MSTPKQATIVGQHVATLAAEETGADLEGRRGFLATERCAVDAVEPAARVLMCTLPPLREGGEPRVATASLATQPPTVAIEPGWVVEGGAAVARAADGATERHAGSVRVIPHDPGLGIPQDVDTRWYAPVAASSPVVRLAFARGQARWKIDARDRALMPRWTAGSADLLGEPEPATVAVAPDGNLVVLALRKAVKVFEYELVALSGTDGAVRWRVPLPAIPWKVMFAPDGTKLVVVAKDAKRCESCAQAIVVSSADGRAQRTVALDSRIAGEPGSAGFTGDHLWFYRFVPEHMTSDVPVTSAGRVRVPPSCDYELHALARPSQPPRTLRDAQGEWKKIAGSCQVRALLPLPSGHLAAIRVLGERELAVVEFDAPP